MRLGYAGLVTAAASAILVATSLAFGGGPLGVRLASHRANSTLFGASASTLDALAQATSKFGHMPIVRIYYPGLPSPDAWTTGVPAAARSAVIVSFKAQPGAILSGADNAALAHFFDTAPAGHPIYYSYYHEPEDNIAAGQFTVSAYKAAWAHIVALANAAHNPDLHSTLILMAWDLNPLSHRYWRNYLPGGRIISTVAWDAYPPGSVKAVRPRLALPADFMGKAVAASRRAGLPFGFAEFGLATSADRPAWLTSVARYMRASGALFGTYFDTSRYRAMNLTDRASIEAWRRVVQNSRTGGPVPSPRPTPSRPAANTPAITGLALSPPAFAPGARDHTVLRFRLTRRADVTACVLAASGAVVRLLARPNRAPGRVSIPYYGYDRHGHRIQPGRYTILLVASSARGSGAAETVLRITGP